MADIASSLCRRVQDIRLRDREVGTHGYADSRRLMSLREALTTLQRRQCWDECRCNGSCHHLDDMNKAMKC